jgi:cytochrome c551/c552
MSNSPERHALLRALGRAALAGVITLPAAAVLAQSVAYPGLGRAATPKEIAAWDIDVRPDFKGLPKGSGSVAQGMVVWEARCASCHGVFGESNEVFSPIVGGTTAADIKTGRVASLADNSYPGRTTLMKLSSLSALWDYINRAMPWTAPKSLSADEVYGVTAYILHMGGVLPGDFTLSNTNMAQAQELLPNRHGKTAEHALWPAAATTGRKPDVMAAACMTQCAGEPRVASSIPDFARNAHGNLALQNRLVGAQRGADTTRPPGAMLHAGTVSAAAVAPTAASLAAAPVAAARPAEGIGAAALALALVQKNACTTCHSVENKLIGPSFRDIAKKHAGRADATAYLAAKMKAGGTGVWGAVSMPPQALDEADAMVIAQWLAGGAGK